jgi:predicted nucleic acid-binding protein
LDGIVAWWGTPIEVRSAFARLAREGELEGVQRTTAINSLDRLHRLWNEVLAAEAVRTLVLALPDEYALRAGDAWQLAAALVWCRERPRGRSFVCWDKRLAQAAAAVGFTVHPK